MHVTGPGALVLERDNGGGRVYAPSRETVLAGDPALGDRVEFAIRPGGEGFDWITIEAGTVTAGAA